MSKADFKQTFQDWFTQQWVKWWGKSIEPQDYSWLISPFGKVNEKGDEFIERLAKEENLLIIRNASVGLIPSLRELFSSTEEKEKLSTAIIDFYENTHLYEFEIAVEWKAIFKYFGKLIRFLFSKRINQLNIPIENNQTTLKSEIIQLIDQSSNEVKYKIWFRTNSQTNEVIYAGIYGICKTPLNQHYIKAVFPLPNGNATVILKPEIVDQQTLKLNSSGMKFGDPGFYFLLKDKKGRIWARFMKTLNDQLTINEFDSNLSADQIMSLWGMEVMKIHYRIKKSL